MLPNPVFYYQDRYFDYDPAGNLTHTEEWGEGGLQFQRDYTYDALHQLLTERRAHLEDWGKGVWKLTYAYDPVGNREQMVHEDDVQPTMTTDYTYDAANRLEERSVGAVSPAYVYNFDANGNMTEEVHNLQQIGRNMTWNRDDRMTQVTNEFAAGSPTVQYVYDAMGRRIMRKKGTEWRMFYYDGLSVAAEKKSANGGGSWAWDALYTLAPGVIGHVLAQSNWNGSSWATTFLHYDHIGNVTLSTISNGGIVDFYDQDAFGNPLEGPASGLRLQTEELDPDAGLYYYFQRWFESEFAQLISKDLIYNYKDNYTFCKNNSIRFIDPEGLKSTVPAPWWGPDCRLVFDDYTECAPGGFTGPPTKNFRFPGLKGCFYRCLPVFTICWDKVDDYVECKRGYKFWRYWVRVSSITTTTIRSYTVPIGEDCWIITPRGNYKVY